jgi:hypothetical protein
MGHLSIFSLHKLDYFRDLLLAYKLEKLLNKPIVDALGIVPFVCIQNLFISMRNTIVDAEPVSLKPNTINELFNDFFVLN